MTTAARALRASAFRSAADMRYRDGKWPELAPHLPTFAMGAFRAQDSLPRNPNLQTVIRLPRTADECAMAVAVVSPTYALAQHAEVATWCFDGIRALGIDASSLRCELGLTALGERMNLRVYLPQEYRAEAVPGDLLDLRLECFNSVDGSSRLRVLFGWLRLVCSNGLVIGKTLVELRDVHTQGLALGRIAAIIGEGMAKVDADRQLLRRWGGKPVDKDRWRPWINGPVTASWGKKAACRVFHICMQGHDVDFVDPFAPGEAADKPVTLTAAVPGSVTPASTLYHASQALAWVATQRTDPDERLRWQREIGGLVNKLRARTLGRVRPRV